MQERAGAQPAPAQARRLGLTTRQKWSTSEQIVGQHLVRAPGCAYRRSMGNGFPGGPTGGLVILALVTLLLGVTVGGVLYQREIAALLRRLTRRVLAAAGASRGAAHRAACARPPPARAELLLATTRAPPWLMIGATRAYDEALAEACRALAVPYSLAGLPSGIERDAERLHVEHQLRAAGLHIDPDHAPSGTMTGMSVPRRRLDDAAVRAAVDEVGPEELDHGRRFPSSSPRW